MAFNTLWDGLEHVGDGFADFAALGPALVDLAASSWLEERLNDAILDHALRVLLLLGHRVGLAACEALLNHPFHGLRWTALRAACGFDPEAGRALLERALRGPHPHIRAAAARALEG